MRTVYVNVEFVVEVSDDDAETETDAELWAEDEVESVLGAWDSPDWTVTSIKAMDWVPE